MSRDSVKYNAAREAFLSEWDRTKYHELFDDFDNVNTVTNWVETEVGASGTMLTLADDAQTTEFFGVDRLLLDNADDDKYN